METSTPPKTSKAINTFTLDLFKKLSNDDKTGNIFYSPFSISSALAMVMLGARGETASQMSKVLCFTEAEPPKPEEGEQTQSQCQIPSQIQSQSELQMQSQSEMQMQSQSQSESQMQSQSEMQMHWQLDSQMQSQMQSQSQMPLQMQSQSQAPSQMQSHMQSQMQTRRQLRQQMQPKKIPEYLQQLLQADDIHANFAKLISEINKPDTPYALSVANRLYGEQSFKFLEKFLAATKKHYSAELESVDFRNSADAARIKINGWVEEHTKGKIKDLLAEGVLDNATRLVLVNAIYFKGDWDKKFKEEFTVDTPFKITTNDTKTVKMMRNKSEFRFASIPEVNSQVLEMPYQGKELSMIIFLPKEIEDDTTGLKKLEAELTYEKFVKWSAMVRQTEVEVNLPRFKMEEMYNLKEVLTSMGMEDAFDIGRSNFTGMSPANQLVLSKVVHKAYVAVNEEGTEAAAATAAVMADRSLSIPEQFIADHPFLFFIQHNPTTMILFAGRFCSPE